MPPPQIPSKPPRQVIPIRRPSMHKAKTTAVPQTVHRSTFVETPRPHHESQERPSRERERGERTAARRPSLGSRSLEKKPTSYSNGVPSRTLVETGRQRRATYYGHEGLEDLERKQREVEEYQAANSGRAVPLTADALRSVRKSHPGSDTASRVSDGSEAKMKSSSKGSGVAKSNSAADDGIRMRFNAGADVKLDFSGDSVEGRRISFRPAQGDNNTLELNIGGRDEARRKSSKKYLTSKEQYSKSLSRKASEEIQAVRKMRADSKSEKNSRRSSRSGY